MSISTPADTQPLRTLVEGSTQTIASQLEGLIRSDIVSGLLKPDERLRLPRLAERYRAGPIPLREALSRLLASGFVTTEDQKGFRVSGISPEEFLDLSSLRSRLEIMALRDSIEKGDSDWELRILSSRHLLQQIKRESGDAATKGVNEDWENRHRAFHAALVSGCGSPLLCEFLESLIERSTRYARISGLAQAARTRNLTDEHDRLANAALARDADKACGLLQDHFVRTRTLVMSVLAKK